MNLQRRLASVAFDLQRRIGASMPRGYRLMLGFMRLAGDAITQGFGLYVYAEFLRAGVSGMPDIHGVPAAEFDTSSPRLINKLPHGYGASLGDRAAKLLYSFGFKTPDVHDLISEYQLELLKGHGIKGGYNLHQAESYVLDGLRKLVLNKLAKDKRRNKYHGNGGRPDDEGHFIEFDPEDPNAYKELDREMTPDQYHKFAEFLRKVHPDLPQYFELAADGVDDKTIWMEGLLPWIKEKKDKGMTDKALNATFWKWKKEKVMPQVERYLRMEK